MSAETVKINAARLDLTGYVTMTDLSTSGRTSIFGGNIETNTITADKLTIGTAGTATTVDMIRLTISQKVSCTIPNPPMQPFHWSAMPDMYSYGQQALPDYGYGFQCVCLSGTLHEPLWLYSGTDRQDPFGKLLAESGQGECNGIFICFQAHGCQRHEQFLTSVSKVVGTSWVRLVRSFTVTSSYPYVSIRVQNNGGSGVTMWFDAIMIEEVESASQSPGIFKPANTTVIDGTIS